VLQSQGVKVRGLDVPGPQVEGKSNVLREEWRDEQPEALDDLVDEFCYQLAAILRRILNFEDGTLDDEDSDT
jgi:hypothetical protein